MKFDLFGVVLGVMGAIASLISLVFTVAKGRNSTALSISLALIFILTCTSSFFSYKYYKVTQPEFIKAKQIESLTKSAKTFIMEYPSFRYYWEEGENEGIAKSGLLILEMHKNLFPDNYETIKADIEKDIEYSKEHRNESGQRHALKSAAQTIYSTMRTLAGPAE